MTHVSSSWPFSQYGMDIISPLSADKWQTKFAVIAIDYFIKWAKVNTLTTITTLKIQSYMWQNIIYYFSMLNVLIMEMNLIKISVETSANVMKLRTTIAHLFILKPMVWSKSLTEPLLSALKKGSTMQRGIGLKSSHRLSRPTWLPSEVQPAKLLFFDL